MKITATPPAELCCPKCRHKWTPRPPKVRRFRVAQAKQPKAVDTSSLSTDDLFKHYKTTAPLEDVRFWVKHARLSPGLRVCFEVLEASIVELRITNRAAIYRELLMLQQMWRQESNQRDYVIKLVASFVPPISADRMLPAAPPELAEAA